MACSFFALPRYYLLSSIGIGSASENHSHPMLRPERNHWFVEYIANGARLGWLFGPYNGRVYVYHPGHAVECLENPTTISADPVLSGFVFNAAEIW